jgi:HPt (histidine-containing phosphotransfer) domain-containing protein
MPENEKLYDTQILVLTHDADQEFVKYMVSVFLTHMPEYNANLEKAAAESDWKNVYFFAHKMKASIDLFDLKKLRDFIRQLEQKAKNETNTETIAADVQFVSDYIKRCIAEMKVDFEL